MKAHCLLLLLATAFVVALAGCSTPRTVPAARHKVVLSDVEGRTIATYIAKGEIIKEESGFRIHAVERRVYRGDGVYELTVRYPLGRILRVIGPNVLVYPLPDYEK